MLFFVPCRSHGLSQSLSPTACPVALLTASTFLVHCRLTIIPEDFMTLQSHVDFVHVWAKVTEQTACKLKGRHLLYFFFPLLSRPSTPNPSLLLTTQNLSFHLSAEPVFILSVTESRGRSHLLEAACRENDSFAVNLSRCPVSGMNLETPAYSTLEVKNLALVWFFWSHFILRSNSRYYKPLTMTFSSINS